MKLYRPSADVFDDQQRFLPAGQVEFHIGPAHRGARSVDYRTRDAAGHLRVGGCGQKQTSKHNPTTGIAYVSIEPQIATIVAAKRSELTQEMVKAS